MKLFRASNKLQKLCIILFIFSFLVFFACGTLLIMNNGRQKQIKTDNQESSDALADQVNSYPENIRLQQAMDLTFYDENGNAKKLSDYKGKNIIILYWSSWCKYCNQEFSLIKEYQELLSHYDNVELILLNKLDGTRETKEQANAYLKKNGVGISNYFDVDLKIYKQLGMKIIPDFIGIDKNGNLKIWYPDNIKSTDQLAAMIDYICEGGSYVTEKFVTEQLAGKDGGIRTNYVDSEQASPAGDDVLSESQGIMMHYALSKQNKDLFDRSLSFVTENMMLEDALAAWMITDTTSGQSGKAKVNSLIDDLRICDAIDQANQLWGGYEEILSKWQTSILKYNTRNHKLIDFYQFDTKKQANTIKLCFADINTLEKMKSTSEVSELLDNTNKLLENGYIGDEFPLYYSSYDYKTNLYSKDDLNMAEEMVTLYNLAKAGKLKKETIAWLKNAMTNGGIKARYTCQGEVAQNYNYDSTAVYATLVMLSKEIGDNELMTQALIRMELMRVNDIGSDFNGSFGKGDGTDIFSYDQSMALLAYAYVEE